MKNIIHYDISHPSHHKYNFGTLEIQFNPNQVAKLQKIVFLIDDQQYFVPLTNDKTGIVPTWIFQRQFGLNRPNDKELDLIATLSEDVVNNHVLTLNTSRLLSAMRPQTELYKRLTDKNLLASEKKALLREFKSANHLIKRMQDDYRPFLRASTEQDK